MMLYAGRVYVVLSINRECGYMVKRLKKRPSTSSSIFDFSNSSGPQTPLEKANTLMTGDARNKANSLLKDETADRLSNTFGVKKKVVEK